MSGLPPARTPAWRCRRRRARHGQHGGERAAGAPGWRPTTVFGMSCSFQVQEQRGAGLPDTLYTRWSPVPQRNSSPSFTAAADRHPLASASARSTSGVSMATDDSRARPLRHDDTRPGRPRDPSRSTSRAKPPRTIPRGEYRHQKQVERHLDDLLQRARRPAPRPAGSTARTGLNSSVRSRTAMRRARRSIM